MAQAAPTYSSIRESLQRGDYAPLYLLHGEESYFIDELVKVFETIIPESERDFNFDVLYGPEVSAGDVAGSCRQYPFMADRRVVILKEAQAMRADRLNKLAPYAEAPSQDTILVIVGRGENVKSRELVAAVRKGGGVIFESKKLNERNIEPVIMNIIKEKGLSVEQKGLAMLRDYLGLDAAKIYNEIEKLAMILGKGAMITPESIEHNVGISKDYNNFELIDAIAGMDKLKAYRIIEYFRNNPKNNPGTVTASLIFNYFSSLLIAHFTRDKSPSSLMAALDLKWPRALDNFTRGMRNYNAFKTIEILSALREYDTRSKGVGSRMAESDLMFDLISKIFNARGVIVV